jgi:hypothetical protein
MLTWWTSLDIVRSVNWWLQAVAAVLGAIAALCVVASLLTTSRIERLQAENDAAERRSHDVRESDLRQKLEDARRSAHAAEVAVTPRHLSDEQLRALTEALKGVPKEEIRIDYAANDREAEGLVFQLVSALNAQGWHTASNAYMSTAAFRPGISVAVKDPEHPTPLALALMKGLTDASLNPTGTHDATITSETPTTRLVVGPKPNN